MSPADAVVYVVDDDYRVREALDALLSSFGFRVATFESASDYVASSKAEAPACLVLDVELPDINGFELQKQLVAGAHPPIVFVTGHGDIPSSVRAMQAGAVDFLPKPFERDRLLAAVHAAIDLDREHRRTRAELASL